MSEGWKNGRYTAFRCPLCASRKYVPVVVQKSNGHWYTTDFFQCFHCTVMFRDPISFTFCRVDTRNDERTPGGAHSMPMRPPDKAP
jgi:hypothetical protein